MKARRERAPQLFLSDEYALFVGTVSDTSTHAHYAVQLTLTLGDSFEVRTDAGHEKCGAAIIPSREPHAVRASAGRLFMLYLDATAPLGGRVAASCKGRGVRTLGVEDVGDCLSAVERYLVTGWGQTDAAVLVDLVVGALVPEVENESTIDPRVRQVLSILDAEACDTWKLTELADRVALSPDRLRHLFSEQLGIPIRSYKSWARVRRAITLLAQGGSLTEVAHEANFVDAAHLSRTFRDMFGITLSELGKSEIELR
mgnify:FL=1